jgi:type I restriction enzyme S subunit
LPLGWVWTSLDSLIVSGPQNGLYLPQTAYGDGTPIVRIDDFQDGWVRNQQDLRLVKCGSDAQATYSLEKDDLVINRVNSMTHLGKALLVSDELGGALFESNMMRMRLSCHVNPAFVLAYLQSPAGRSRLIADAKWAVNQASINQTDVKRTVIPLPPRAEQDEIASRVIAALRGVAELHKEIDADVSSAATLRHSILQAAFSGRLALQDPTDEPASTLLARLRGMQAASRRTSARRSSMQPDLIETQT